MNKSTNLENVIYNYIFNIFTMDDLYSSDTRREITFNMAKDIIEIVRQNSEYKNN